MGARAAPTHAARLEPAAGQDVDRFLHGTRAGKRDKAVILDALAVGIHVVDQLAAAGNLVGVVEASDGLQ